MLRHITAILLGLLCVPTVLCSQDLPSPRNLGLAGDAESLAGDHLVLSVSETAEGEDLNGDGDTNDIVAHVHDLATGETQNLALAIDKGRRRVRPIFGNSGPIFGNSWLIEVSESSQGQDLNGDGTGLIFGINDESLGFILLTVPFLVFSAFYVAQKDAGIAAGGENDDSGLSL